MRRENGRLILATFPGLSYFFFFDNNIRKWKSGEKGEGQGAIRADRGGGGGGGGGLNSHESVETRLAIKCSIVGK